MIFGKNVFKFGNKKRPNLDDFKKCQKFDGSLFSEYKKNHILTDTLISHWSDSANRP